MRCPGPGQRSWHARPPLLFSRARPLALAVGWVGLVSKMREKITRRRKRGVGWRGVAGAAHQHFWPFARKPHHTPHTCSTHTNRQRRQQQRPRQVQRGVPCLGPFPPPSHRQRLSSSSSSSSSLTLPNPAASHSTRPPAPHNTSCCCCSGNVDDALHALREGEG